MYNKTVYSTNTIKRIEVKSVETLNERIRKENKEKSIKLNKSSKGYYSYFK